MQPFCIKSKTEFTNMDFNSRLLAIVCLAAMCSGQCHDVDTAACQSMAAQDPNFCQTSGLSDVACPQFCKKCSLMCYQCDYLVSDPTRCDSTLKCQQGAQCIMYQLTSPYNGHSEYKLGCASQSTCDNLETSTLFTFGRRGIRSLEVNAQCCSEDLCNWPSQTHGVTESTTKHPTTASIATTATVTTAAPVTTAALTASTASPVSTTAAQVQTQPITTTVKPACGRDIEAIVQKSEATKSRYVTQFLKSLVSQMEIGPNQTQMGLATFDSSVKTAFSMVDYTSKPELLNALDRLHIHAGDDDSELSTGNVWKFLQDHLHTGKHHDRPNYIDVGIILTDQGPEDDRRRFLYDTILDDSNPEPHLDGNIIVVNIGTAIQHSAFSGALVVDHVINVPTYTDLANIIPQLLTLACE